MVSDFCQNYRDWWNRKERFEIIRNCLNKIDLKNKTVLETGSRFGLYCYLSLLLDAKHVTGIEIDPKLSFISEKLFKNKQINENKYKFVNSNILNHKGYYDVVLYLGLFYNIANHELLLRKFHHCPQILVESHTKSNHDKIPIIHCESNSKIMKYGTYSGEKMDYQQYYSNQARLHQVFKRSGFSYQLLEKYGLDYFYLLSPIKQPENCINRWGMNNRINTMYL